MDLELIENSDCNNLPGKTMDASADLSNPNFDGLLGPDFDCGYAKDCPQWYTVAALEKSASISNSTIIAHFKDELHQAKSKALEDCTAAEVIASGGWCLNGEESAPLVKWHDGTEYAIPVHHVPVAPRLVIELSKLIEQENIQSINDFGCGVGQMEADIATRFPSLTYHSYDGAGNVEQYTKGKVTWFDLTKPLFLPIADWVMSFEVGEHVPTQLRDASFAICTAITKRGSF